jgi:hypothetical protein
LAELEGPEQNLVEMPVQIVRAGKKKSILSDDLRVTRKSMSLRQQQALGDVKAAVVGTGGCEVGVSSLKKSLRGLERAVRLVKEGLDLAHAATGTASSRIVVKK